MDLEVEAYVGELRKLRKENSKFREIVAHAPPEEIEGLYFICGEAGEKDKLGLPQKIHVCLPEHLDGYAVYTKTSKYRIK